MLWIQSQTPLVIGLLVFAATYLVTGAIFFLTLFISRGKGGEQLKTLSPATLTPLGVILGLLIAFLAARVWTNVDRAGEYSGQEASAVREAVLLADLLPPEVRSKVRVALKEHIRFIVDVEWPAMGAGRANLRTLPLHLQAALTTILSFTAGTSNQQLTQSRTVVAIETALEARRHRLRVSRNEIAPLQWAVIIVPATMILLTIAMAHMGKPLVMGVTMTLFATAIGICLMLLMVYDRPFNAGGYFVAPTALLEVMPE